MYQDIVVHQTPAMVMVFVLLEEPVYVAMDTLAQGVRLVSMSETRINLGHSNK